MRKNFKAVLDFKKPEKLPIVEWAGWWDKTVERWRDDGLPQEMETNLDITKYLGLDIHHQYWLNPQKSIDCHRDNIIASVKQQQNDEIIIWLTLE